MKKTFVNYLFLVLTAGFIYSCNTEAKRSAEEINNASTAEVKTTSQDAAAAGAPTTATTNLPALTFSETSFDFGKIQEGDTVKHTFGFTNTGKAPLIIQNATAQCGCTVPEWTRTPIAPGDKGEVSVVFNSKGKAGVQSKAVTVTANTQPENTQVVLQGIVESGVSDMKGPYKAN